MNVLQIANHYVNSHARQVERVAALTNRLKNESMPDDRRVMIKAKLRVEQRKLDKLQKYIDQWNY